MAEEQFDLLRKVLRKFEEAGILNDLMLIESWCSQFYRYHFEHPERLPAFRTTDVDFLIPHASRIKIEVDVPGILKNEGFVPIYNRSNGIVKYNYKELQVEFFVPEPPAFALHKLIISTRRLNKEKARKDLEMAIGLLEFLYEKPDGVARIKLILRTMPGTWRQIISSVSKKYSLKLNEIT